MRLRGGASKEFSLIWKRSIGAGVTAFIMGWATVGFLGATSACGEVRDMPVWGIAHFVLQDDLGHPFFWWPTTLLSYTVRIDGAGPQRDRLVLTNALPAW
jgi:hypothetical protein